MVPVFIIAAWIYIWRRLILTSKLSPKKQRALTWFFFFLLFVELVTPFITRWSRHSRHPLNFLIVTYVILGFVDLLLFFTIAKDIVLLASKLFPSTRQNPSRRLFLTQSLNLAAIGLAGGATIIGTETALAGPEIKKISVPVPNLHPDLHGFKIVQITDFHIGNLVQQKQVEHVVDLIKSLEPDLIAFTGDFADGPVSELINSTEPLRNISAPYGKFYVTGNHEYYWDVDEWTDRAKALGFDYLYNEHRNVKIKNATLTVGGVADYNCKRSRPDHETDPIGSLKGATPSDFKILLAHQPKSCFAAFDAGYDLQISGHTHNGQFFPNSLVIKLFHPYVKGLNLHKNKMWVYVSAGTGFWGPPQRLGIPSEVTLLTLTNA
jgi:uncharacterized protein